MTFLTGPLHPEFDWGEAEEKVREEEEEQDDDGDN